ncbi:MFS transporter [Oceanicoccus sp. KOV_DT_Chl]|uniref:spinster family MFS transporter n=1 Tax=Oceanicoccus sp. KOV_DT_Chl TaxID=1904639 RepID=UPI000C7B007A|nr:MFS transporter [Oceanicoccus sp. KOV_DT_Chl]
MPQSNSEYPQPSQSWYLLAILFLAYTLSFIDRQIITLLVAPIRADLGISDFEFSLLHGFAFAIFFALLGLPIGRMADKHNRRNIIAAGILVWSVMTALCGLAKNFSHLFIARMGVGVGEATLMPSAYSMLSDAFPPDKLTKAIAIFSLGGPLGTGIALILGGAIINLIADAGELSLFGWLTLKPWQSAFLIVGIPGILVAAIMLSVIEPKRQGLLIQQQETSLEIPIKQVLHFFLQHKATYGVLFIVTAFMTALNAGYLMWYPTFLVRNFQQPIAEAGQSFGLLFMVFGTAGIFAGSNLATFFNNKGYEDANMRVMAIATSLALIPFVLSPLMPTIAGAMIMMAMAITATQMLAAVCVASIQLITPTKCEDKHQPSLF